MNVSTDLILLSSHNSSSLTFSCASLFFTVEFIMLFFIFCLLLYGTVKSVSTDSLFLPKMHVFSILVVLTTFILVTFFLDSSDSISDSNIDTSYYIHAGYDNIVECFILLLGFFIFSFTYNYNKFIGILSFEYYIIMLFCLCSFCFFVHANNLVFMYVLIELQSICSYVLTSMNKHSRYSIEAGLKYFILGSFSSILLLFGFSFVYGFSGFIYVSDLTSYIRYLYAIEDDFFLYSLLMCLIFVNVGFLFKIYASPFHFWISDIYQGAPTSVTMFLSTVPVFSYIYMFIKLYVLIFSDVFSFYNYILYILSVLSMLSGVFGALIQRKIKKLVAYSSVSTVGYILSSLSADNVLMVQQCFLYVLVYLFNIVPIFIIVLNYRVNNRSCVDNIRSFSSLYASNKALFLILFSFFLSLAGVPPFSGFASKLSLFTALGSEGFFLLLSIGLFVAIISCYYYLRVVKMIFYDASRITAFFSMFSYASGFVSGCFFLFNIFFLFFYSVFEDISLYISICLYLSL